ncbi:hypothetical protein LTR62_003484 [Meristemomyces frigidus]|uniref:GED domain-containing protein n=1 Tax=Meristemomyces frigidus TaxID=1508187 RepID=A0AAN7TJ86_9PEZI|nr:hypothetical protein LTR62_003484 [Meristemomyces frigidus]
MSPNTPRPEPQLPSSGDTTIMDSEMSGSSQAHQPQNATTNGQPESNAMLDLARHSRQLIQGIHRLESLNIDATLPSLPRFIVVGDQSAGKSSIVEAICDITVPRDQGTCTRCPFQITTSAASDLRTGWTCEISLHIRYKPVPHGRAGDEYEGWKQQELVEYPFATLHDKSLLGDGLRRAQCAILNPSRGLKEYLEEHYSNDIEVAFSPNVVSIKIESAGLPELSFFDLPGAINVDADGHDHLVTLVEKLIKSYVREPDTLVLLACSADQDIENSTAFRFVKECKAEGRCLGVLTKPDLIGPMRIPLIEHILTGQKFKLANPNAWFVTKQLAQEDLERGCDRAQARRIESAFFDQSPWTTTLAAFAARFGTTHLQSAVSEKLTEQILKNLPTIFARVEDRLCKVDAELAGFPDKPKSACLTVLQACDDISCAVSGYIIADGTNIAFRSTYKKCFEDAQAQLANLRPRINLNTPGYQKPSISLDSDGSDEAPSQPSTQATPSKRKRGNPSMSCNGTPSTSRNIPVRGTPGPRTPVHPQAVLNPRSGRTNIDMNGDLQARRLMLRLDEVRRFYDSGTNSGLPDQQNPKVTDWMIMKSVRPWEQVASKLMDEIVQVTTDMLKDSLNAALASRKETRLFDDAAHVLETLFAKLVAGVKERITNTVACELRGPLTYQDMKSMSAKTHKKLQDDRANIRIDEHFDTQESCGKKVPLKPAQYAQRKELEAGMLGMDDWGHEVRAMATLQTYYDIAAARLHDTLALQIDYNLFHLLRTEVSDTLRTKIRITDETHCVGLIAEDPAREAVRARLEAEKGKLTVALKALRSLPGSFETGGGGGAEGFGSSPVPLGVL